MRLSSQKGFSVAIVFLIVIVLAAIGGASFNIYATRKVKSDQQKTITNFAECAAAGNPIMESYPEQCAANGQTFVNLTQQVR